MKLVRSIIIEDQIPAQKTLEEYVAQVPYLKLIGTYISPIEAMDQVKDGLVDLIFLDIHLPKINGIDFLAALTDPPQIILTTAFSEYAIRGFDLNVLDYLLKPYSFQRFLQAVVKVQTADSTATSTSDHKHLFVRTSQQIERITISEVQYVEAKGDFVVIHMDTGASVIATIPLKTILYKLGEGFSRCHKSYVVNVGAIEKLSGNRIFLHDTQIPIGRTYKDQLLAMMNMI